MSNVHRSSLRVLLVVLGLVTLTSGEETLQKVRQVEPTERPPDAGLVPPPSSSPEARRVLKESPAPSVRARYRTLLRTIDAPNDQSAYGDFCDFGYWSGTAYADQHDLPPGYWVYLAPKWYIFKEPATGSMPSRGARPWGPEQATGKPDTWPQSGDRQTAWASLTPDGQPEWLELTYDQPVRPSAILVYETYNPGAVNRVTAFGDDGKEVELWAGNDPTPAGREKGISVIPVQPPFDLKRVRIYLDSPKVAGWNEIDAVGLLDEGGTTHWATGATASSTYADQTTAQPRLTEPEVIFESEPSLRIR